MSSASDTTQRRRARVLYADRIVQQTTFASQVYADYNASKSRFEL